MRQTGRIGLISSRARENRTAAGRGSWRLNYDPNYRGVSESSGRTALPGELVAAAPGGVPRSSERSDQSRDPQADCPAARATGRVRGNSGGRATRYALVSG